MKYQCQCSASGSQGRCPFSTDQAEEMTEHYRVNHSWPGGRAMPHQLPCSDWGCGRTHDILRTGPIFASFHAAGAD